MLDGSRQSLRRLAVLAGTVAVAAAVGAVSAANGAQPGASKSIGVVSFAYSDPGTAVMAKSFNQPAQAQGFKVSVIDSQGDPGKAVAAMQNFVQQKVSAIVVQIWTPSQVRAGLSAATAAGIPVLGLGSELGGPNGFRGNAVLGSDGKILGQYIAKTTKGKGAMLVIGYSPGLPARMREQALTDALKQAGLLPGITITRNELNVIDINGSVTNSVNAWLAKNPTKSSPNLAVWVPSECCVVSAVNAIRRAGRTDIKVYGFVDGVTAALKPLRQGYATALGSYDAPDMGRGLTNLTVQAIKNGVHGKQMTYYPKTELVTKATVSAFMQAHPELGH